MKKIFESHIAIGNSPGQRTGRGAAVPAFSPPRDLQGLPPLPRVSGQQGDMTTAPSVSASRLGQKTMNQDDIEYWTGDPENPNDHGASFNPPYVLNRDAYGNMKTAAQNGAGGSTVENTLRNTIKLMIETVLDEDEDEETGKETSEISTVGGGAIRGYQAPLGAKKRDKKQDKINTESFGGGKYVK